MFIVNYWNPSKTHQFGGGSFSIRLFPEWFIKAKESGINQEICNKIVTAYGKDILRNHGWDIKDDENIHTWMLSIRWDDEKLIPLISVPGNACQIGFDPNDQGLSYRKIGDKEEQLAQLTCHNTDTLAQASIQLTLFIKVAEFIYPELML